MNSALFTAPGQAHEISAPVRARSSRPAFQPSIDTAIDHGEVDVWRIDLDVLTPAAWPQALTVEDFVRADRFIQHRDRNRFLQARFSLRMLLAGYSGLAPRSLGFQFNAHGKPSLPPRHGLAFNLSHSGNLAAIAIGRQQAIGIDIECMKPPDEPLSLAQLVFSAEECDALAALPDEATTLAFLTCWTRKEAYLKALGVGFTREPCSVTVGLAGSRSQVQDLLHSEIVEVETISADNDAVISLAVSCGGLDWHGNACTRQFEPFKIVGTWL
jgi:4'-phosphopantetheinyl transferase